MMEKSEELGRPLYFHCVTFGCQMNARDSEKLCGILRQIGFLESDGEDADFVIYNTCTVRDNANQKSIRAARIFEYDEAQNPHMKIALCGCMMQEPSVIEKIRKSYRFVDLILERTIFLNWRSF